MAKRQAIYVKEFKHANPIPVAARIGPFVQTGVITGKDPETGDMPESMDDQLTNLFAHISRIAIAAGGSTEDILKITFWMNDPSERAKLNAPWVQMFPDEDTRPTRHTLPGGSGASKIQCSFTAVMD
ncbi:MAG: RidA family protein [Rhodospirillales bacterium]|nr:RidA family protein [Rhodospirillales bacterium]